MMFRAVLYSQWKWSRGPLLLAACAAFAVPLLSIRGRDLVFEELNARGVLAQMREWGMYYALLALAVGLIAGLLAWRADHAGRHVYALTLPVERWRYALMRFAAGAVTLSGPVAALFVGAVLAVQTATIPPGLEGHPVALTARFALGVLLAYALCFAAASTSPRTSGLVLGVLAAVVVADLLLGMLTGDTGLLDVLSEVAFGELGLLHVFVGRWMLIDV